MASANTGLPARAKRPDSTCACPSSAPRIAATVPLSSTGPSPGSTSITTSVDRPSGETNHGSSDEAWTLSAIRAASASVAGGSTINGPDSTHPSRSRTASVAARELARSTPSTASSARVTRSRVARDSTPNSGSSPKSRDRYTRRSPPNRATVSR